MIRENSLQFQHPVTRRQVIMSTIAGCFAAAPQPAIASPQQTVVPDLTTDSLTEMAEKSIIALQGILQRVYTTDDMTSIEDEGEKHELAARLLFYVLEVARLHVSK